MVKLTDYYPVSQGTAYPGQSTAPLSASGLARNKFESYLKTEKPAPDTRKAEQQQKKIQTQDAVEDAGAKDAVKDAPSEAVKENAGQAANKTAETAEPTGETAQAGKSAETAETSPEKPAAPVKGITSDEAEKLLAEMAALLGLPVAELMALLADKGIDVTAGIKPEETIRLAQAALGAESPVELLWQPEAAKMIEGLNTLAEEYRQIIEAAPVKETPVTETPVVQAKPEAAAEVVAGTVKENTELAEDVPEVKAEEVTTVEVKAEKPETGGETRVKAEALPEQAVAESGGEEEVIAVTAARPESAESAPARQTQTAAAVVADDEVNLDTQQLQNPAPLNPVTDAQLAQVKETLVRSASTVETVEVVKQLVEQMKVSISPDTTELRLTLKPESLGEVTMRVITQNGIVTAEFIAENQRVKEAIEASLNNLRSALSEKGVNVAEMTAFVADGGGGQNGEGFNPRRGERVSGSRITRVMRRNGLETGEIDAEAEEMETERPRSPLEVSYKA